MKNDSIAASIVQSISFVLEKLSEYKRKCSAIEKTCSSSHIENRNIRVHDIIIWKPFLCIVSIDCECVNTLANKKYKAHSFLIQMDQEPIFGVVNGTASN